MLSKLCASGVLELRCEVRGASSEVIKQTCKWGRCDATSRGTFTHARVGKGRTLNGQHNKKSALKPFGCAIATDTYLHICARILPASIGRARNCVSVSRIVDISILKSALQSTKERCGVFEKYPKLLSRRDNNAQSGARTVRRVGLTKNQRTAAPLTVSQISRGRLAGHSYSKNGHTTTSRAGNILPLPARTG